MVKTLVHIILKFSSDWKLFHFEIQRTRQVLVDTNNTLYIVDSIIENVMDKDVDGDLVESEAVNVKLYVNSDNLSLFNND